ncbi:hypothetical protein M231_04413 [Tremella mesenterica]|uniref:Inositol polyphosphate-related phosphatase domain-containing protein n=1 Tax=Tremella mesenterica TaxID=5217 RepID=A0A4Q1BKS7_TREME|nr:hypothetical protein M231_04413 [Tremella mesenterica]
MTRSTKSMRPPPTYESNVLHRLHALFAPAPHLQNSNAEETKRSNTDAGEEVKEKIVDRDAIKVMVVTWNMGDAVPKGDLSVLFGNVPQYSPTSPIDGLPDLGVEDSHPYHIVVVAGQECPTHSGVPRGLGGGLMKGVSMTGHRKDKDKEQKELTVDMEKEVSGELKSPNGELKALPPLPKGYDMDEGIDGEGKSRTASPLTPGVHRSSKGWSTMLDEWFCGPAPEIKSGFSTPVLTDWTSGNSSSPFGLTSQPPQMSRSNSAPTTPKISSPMLIPRPNATHHLPLPLATSPLGRSQSSLSSSGTSSDEAEASYANFLSVPKDASGLLPHKLSSGSLRQKPEKLGIVIPPSPNPGAMGGGEKCYVHVVKERLMGMYLSVYVYKGCQHLVQGVDKDFVTAGLAGGRLGNKGGIGISLKLADHTFLFVNSHLAAHTSRQHARLANIEKIKSDLRLDCFLPKDDPRANEKDITDKFDTVFWCGDLNFRVDLSRLHAEWLVEQKKYAEALMWDQLRNAMMNSSSNPFPGFQEATIDFPPTFKYDVWKSIKATAREQRRSLRRRNTNESPHRPSSSEPGTRLLDHVPEADDHEELAGETEPCDEGNVTDNSGRRSYESYANSRTNSFNGTDPDDEESDIVPTYGAGAYGSRHRALEAAVKVKTKHFLSLIKLDAVLTPPRKGRRKVNRAESREFEDTSRRTSVSSLASGKHSGEIGIHDDPLFSTSGSPANVMRGSAGMSSGSVAKLSRLTSLKRSVSGRATRKVDDDCDEDDEEVDTREGVYDSSKKQRVPSWCDRVLWKAHIIPDPSSSDHLMPPPSLSRDRFSRLSQAFTHFGDHFRPGRSTSIEPAHIDRVRINRPLPPTPPHDPDSPNQFVASPIDSTLSSRSPTTGTGLVPRPKPTLMIKSPTNDSPTPKRHPLLNGENWSPPSQPSITFDRASSHDRSFSSPVNPNLRRRANSDLSRSAPRSQTMISPSISAGPMELGSPIHTEASSSHLSPFVDRPHTNGASSEYVTSKSSSNHNWRRTQTIGVSHLGQEGHDDRNSFSRFIKDMSRPSWLIPRGNLGPGLSRQTSHVIGSEDGKVKRHQRGEVVCLHYGTIDDAGMRQLEGRSDHRPAIFSCAVYV